MISANIILDQNLHDKLEEKYEKIGIKFKNEKFSQCLLFLFHRATLRFFPEIVSLKK